MGVRTGKHPDGELVGGHRKRQYGRSVDTWTRASRRSEQNGLLRTMKIVWGDEGYEMRARKHYLPVPLKPDEMPYWSDS
jgi:hypothetical protein